MPQAIPASCWFVGGALPRPYKKGKRSLAPRVYEGGGPKGRGEKSNILPNSPSHGFRRASPLLKAGAKGAEVISEDCHVGLRPPRNDRNIPAAFSKWKN